jgi:LysM repeat protein
LRRVFLRENPGAKEPKTTNTSQKGRQQRQNKMNNENPLVPQSSMLEQKTKGRARARLAMFFVCILGIHVMGLMALLTAAGCKREQPPSAPPETNVVLPTFEATNVPAVDTNLLVAPPVTPPLATPAVTPPAPAPSGVTEYIVAKGDSFYSIGKKLGVPTKAIQDANPGVDPTKLQIGQKLVIPSPMSSPSSQAAPAHVESAVGVEQVYVVKSGDTLTRIAAEHGTTVKALRAANDLKTDQIKVGQKLKVPGKISSPSPAAPVEPALLSPPPTPAPTTQPSR